MEQTSGTQPIDSTLVSQLVKEGYAALEQRDLAKAVTVFGDAVEKNSHSAPAHYGLALARFSADDFPESRVHAEAAAQLDPQNADYELLLGMVYRELEELDTSAAHLRQAAELNPTGYQAWRELGTTQTILGLPDQAAESLERAVSLNPQDVDAIVDLGHILHLLGEHDRAVSTLRQAHSLRPADATILQSLGQMYADAGDNEAATDAFSGVLKAEPNNVPAQIGLAWLYLDMDRFAEAESAFLRACQIDAEHELYAQHGIIWSRVQQGNWRAALDATIEALKLDRFALTTDILKFITDQLFREVKDLAERQEELETRLRQEHQEHLALHSEMPF